MAQPELRGALTAAVVRAGRILAKPPCLGRGHIKKPNPLTVDFDCVAVDDRGDAG